MNGQVVMGSLSQCSCRSCTRAELYAAGQVEVTTTHENLFARTTHALLLIEASISKLN